MEEEKIRKLMHLSDVVNRFGEEGWEMYKTIPMFSMLACEMASGITDEEVIIYLLKAFEDVQSRYGDYMMGDVRPISVTKDGVTYTSQEFKK